MEFSLLGTPPIVTFNNLIGLLFGVAYFYQMVYIVSVWIHGEVKLPKAKKK